MTTAPFASAVQLYQSAGWPAILPVPIEKSPPPVGYTGAEGADTGPEQLGAWAVSHAASSIAIRLPDGVIGIDVDAYAKGQITKHGDATLAQLEAQWGQLPATWSSTARGSDSASRIRFYRVPLGRYVTKFPDVEIIQRHHRYAVVWPSPHPEVGDIYRWQDPNGVVADGVAPRIEWLSELPASWLAGLKEGATDNPVASADRGSGEYLLAQLENDTRDACIDIRASVATAWARTEGADVGSRHDIMTGRIHHLIQLAAAGHNGVGSALGLLAYRWEQLTPGEDRSEEFARMLLTSARKAVTVVGLHQIANDPCAGSVGTVPTAIQAGPAYTDDAQDAEHQPEPVMPPRELHPRAVIGADWFDPRGNLDQTLAEAVLERMYPALRFGYDTGQWLRRQPVTWETGDELSEWAVSQVASLMPAGDLKADKDSELYAQAARRKRFMTSAGAGGIARKMRSLVAGGAHPCALRVADLDTEPWLLWAGGVGWDLAASVGVPTAALIDPAAPHLRSAGVSPEIRDTPLWDAFTAAVFPDAELRAWAIRCLSVAVTGYADKSLPVLIGDKDRGKTQLVQLIMSVLGSYAHSADPRLLTSTDNAHASIVYALKGRRLSFIDEAPRDSKAGQERLKQLTGGGDLTGNAMRANPVTFSSSHTLILTANDEPRMTDPAVRSRIRLIPCVGDPAEVIRARGAIGHVTSPSWRREAPGVLAKLMAEAGAWMADRDSGSILAAPEAYRFLAEEIAAEQDHLGRWVAEETKPDERGTRARDLYLAFRDWCKAGGIHDNQILSETKFGRDLSAMGVVFREARDGKYRALILRTHSVFGGHNDGTGAWIVGGQSVDSSNTYCPQDQTDGHPSPGVPQTVLVDSVDSCFPIPPQQINKEEYIITGELGVLLNYTKSPLNVEANYPHGVPRTESGKIRERLEQARLQGVTETAKAAPVPKTSTAAEKAAQKRAAARAEAILTAEGGTIELPAIVTRNGQIASVNLAQAAQVLQTFGVFDAMTVDVEHSGYPVAHADYQLRSIQLGNDQVCVYLDALDAEQAEAAKTWLARAEVLHAHSAQADIVPLAVAGLVDADEAWRRMYDTVIPAKLADPQSTGPDPDLKHLAANVLGPEAATLRTDPERAALFAAGKWLTKIKPGTPAERSGWAQVDRRSATMVRYGASDVLDTAALVTRLPGVVPALLERERTAQRVTARITLEGLGLDAEHVLSKLDEHRAQLELANQFVRGFGVDNPGSDQQVGRAMLGLGAKLPLTPTGKPSVKAGVIEPYQHRDDALGAFVKGLLIQRHHDQVVSTFLEPYADLINRGDGRARPTVYTLSADTGRMSCVESTALVEMPRDLAKYPDGVPITQVKAGDWVYAFDHNRELVLQKVKWCEQTGVRQTVIVTVQNGEGHQLKLRLTPEHLVRLRSGDWRAAENLMHAVGRPHREDGPRVMTMVKRIVDDGYVKFFPHSVARKGAGVKGGGKVREHRWIVEQTTGKRVSTKTDVDHIDGNRANNGAENLRPLSVHEHRGNRSLAWGTTQPKLDVYDGPTDYHVVSVEPGLIEPVWDMEVEEVHNFIANGICVHNCVRPNLQQVPREGGIRACFVADPGMTFISADFAGVELRVAAALSQDATLMELIASGGDLHMMVAKQAFGPEATKHDRYNAKRAVFGRLYGSGIPGIAMSQGIPESHAAAIVETLDALTPGLAAWSAEIRNGVRSGHVVFPSYAGRVIHLDRRQPHKAPNYCIQGSAREILVDTLVKWEQTKWSRCVLMPVHDEVLVQVPEHEAEEALGALVQCMTRDLMGVHFGAEANEPSRVWRDAV